MASPPGPSFLLSERVIRQLDWMIAVRRADEGQAKGGLPAGVTADQTAENQTRVLEAAAAARGWSVVQTYADAAVSGAKGRHKRPQLNAMLRAAVRRRTPTLIDAVPTQACTAVA